MIAIKRWGGKPSQEGHATRSACHKARGVGVVESVKEENKVLRKCKNSHDELPKAYGGAEWQVVVDSRGGGSSGNYHDDLTESLWDL